MTTQVTAGTERQQRPTTVAAEADPSETHGPHAAETVDDPARTVHEIDYAHVSILTGDAAADRLWTSPETGLRGETCSDVSGAR